MSVEVVGIAHIYLAVAELHVAEAFYDSLMPVLEFKKSTFRIANAPHVSYFNREIQITLRPAKNLREHDPYAPGLHHLCLAVASREAVDEVARELSRLGIAHDAPRDWPEYTPDYYATFFNDPDGIRWEIVAPLGFKQEIRRRWRELTDFENPLSKLFRRDAEKGRS